MLAETCHKIDNVWEYRSCKGCGLRFLWPSPSLGLLASRYGTKDYFFSASETAGGYKDYSHLKTGFFKTFKRRQRVLKSKSLRGLSVLEVGCGMGYFGEFCQEQGATYLGLDINPFAIEALQAKSLPALVSTLEDLSDKGPYDLIAFFDVLEHVPDPVAFLASARSRVQNGGRIFFSTPSTSSWLATISGRRWVSYIVPDHLHLFSRKLMKKTLTKAGFEQIEIKSDIQFVPLDFLVNRISKLLNLEWLLRPFERGLRLLHITVPVPNGNMLVMASKAL